MKFVGKTDINATLNATFAAFADFESFERRALRAGAEITRTDDLSMPGPGMMWDARFAYRGKTRKIAIELVDYDPPNRLIFSANTEGFESEILVDLIPLSSQQTRASVSFDVHAKSLAAKLLLQSARLTKGAINKRFRRRLARFGKDLESRIQSA